MCGFSGFVDLSCSKGGDTLTRIANEMGEAIAHRGPDDAQTWVQPEAGFAVAFRRLAIVDLSRAGRQPMVSKSRTFVISFNGEVYNAPKLRRELEGAGAKFRGHSDTEIVLEAFDQWGIEKTLPRLVGMFAIVLWNRHERELTLIRDRMGIKPLYYGKIGQTFFFGSQPKSFFKHPDWKPDIDLDSVTAYMRFAYVPSPRSVFKGLNTVAPAEVVKVKNGEVQTQYHYWNHEDWASSGYANRARLNEKEAVIQFEILLADAIEQRLMSDVPLGAFLSGGIDSSTVAALMQIRSSRPISTFTIGFEEQNYNEAIYAKEVARHLKTEHHEMYVTSKDTLDVIPKMPIYFDEPFADPSQIPTYLLSALTRNHVTVSLSGDGGDELFAGYPRYSTGDNIVQMASRVPAGLRPSVAKFIRKVPGVVWDALAPFVPRKHGKSPLKLRALRTAGVLEEGGEERLFRSFVERWSDPAQIVIGGRETVDKLWNGAMHDRMPDFIERMQYLDAVTYLPDDILVKVDRASMANSLEVRVPLIDHRIVEFCYRLPKHMKIRERQSKWLLRQVLYRHVPKELFDRPKMGFGVPIDKWLRGPLRDWAEDLLDQRQLEEDGIFNPASIREHFDQHLSGKRSWEDRLWVVLMFQAWKRQWIDA